MATYDEVIVALGGVLETTGTQVYLGDDQRIERPAIVIGWPESYDPRAALGGLVDLVIPCRVEVVCSRDFKAANAALRDYISDTGDKSLIAAIVADRDLGGVVDDVAPLEWTNFGYREVADNLTVVQAELRVEVYV